MTEDLRKLLAEAAEIASERREKAAESRMMAAMLRDSVTEKHRAQGFDLAADYAELTARVLDQFPLLEAESASLRERVAEWQPIETAPTSGKIDIWVTDSDGKGRRIADCYYDRICDEWRTSAPAQRLHCVKAICVTHWMRMPEPPAALSKEGG